jgi:GAF domain-containing protein
MTNEEVRAMLKLFARQLEIAAELKQIKEGTK